MHKGYGRRYYDAFCRCCGREKSSVFLFGGLCSLCYFLKLLQRKIFWAAVLAVTAGICYYNIFR